MEKHSEQISTKEFIQSVVNYFKYLGQHWRLLLIVLLIGNIYDVIKNFHFKDTTLYGGNIEFNVDLQGGTGGGGQMAGLASAFGMGGASASGGLLDGTNFPNILMSRQIFVNALMTEVELYGRKDLLVNFYVDSSDIKKKEWSGSIFRKPSPYSTIKFTKKEYDEFEVYENQALNDIYAKLSDETFLEIQQGTSIYKLDATTANELLTKTWLETLVKTTEEFYNTKKTVKTRRLINIQQKRVDSLKALINVNDKSLAKSTFEQPDVVNPYAGSNITSFNRNNTYLTNQYVTTQTNLQTLKNLLIEQEPIFTILSPVTLPLFASGKYGIDLRLTGLILLIATIFILTIKKSLSDIMTEEDQ